MRVPLEAVQKDAAQCCAYLRILIMWLANASYIYISFWCLLPCQADLHELRSMSKTHLTRSISGQLKRPWLHALQTKQVGLWSRICRSQVYHGWLIFFFFEQICISSDQRYARNQAHAVPGIFASLAVAILPAPVVSSFSRGQQGDAT